MRKSIVILLFLFSAIGGYAQELAFINKTQNKIITIRLGNKLHLAYLGYNNQLEYCANIVSEITDSTITLGIRPFDTNKRLNHKINRYKVIKIADIVAFRKRKSGIEIAKNFAQIGAITASIFILRNLYAINNIGSGSALLFSLGTGLSINLAIKGLFPENAKHRIKDGWEIKYLQTP
jgi:hypothetical protein